MFVCVYTCVHACVREIQAEALQHFSLPAAFLAEGKSELVLKTQVVRDRQVQRHKNNRAG